MRVELPTGFMLVHANQPEALRDLLVAWLQRHPLPPLAAETILVQSNGMAQWLKLALAAEPQDGGCGVAAGLDLQLPAHFLWRAYRAVLGEAAVPPTSPFDKAALTWRLMRLLGSDPGVRGQTPGTSARDRVFAPLHRFVGDDPDGRRLHQLAGRLADLFDQYQVYRADWLAAWATGQDVWIDSRGQSQPLPAAQRWQPALWRRVLDDVSDRGEDAQSSRAGVHAQFLAALAEGREPVPGALPQRVVVFGMSSLPRQSVEVLAALGRWCQVLVCLHNPCQFYWADLLPGRELLRSALQRQARRPGQPVLEDVAQLARHGHPLLAAWGRQGRDFMGLLDEFDEDGARAQHAAWLGAAGQRTDLFVPYPDTTLLGQLQEDIRVLRPVAETRTTWAPVDPVRDSSIRFHVAHSALREVEVLHDQLLAAFDADPSLQPRDVMVMVPDVATYAPAVQAIFGLPGTHDRRHIPFSLADLGARDADPLLRAIDLLFGLARGRATVSDVLALLDASALRRRFGVALEDLPMLQRWLEEANVRWGLHEAQRTALGLPADATLARHTWAFGLSRMQLGYAVGLDGPAWDGVEPYGEVGGLDAASLGPLVLLIRHLGQVWQDWREACPPLDWLQRLRRLLEASFTAEADEDVALLQRLLDVASAWVDTCEQAGFDDPVPVDVVSREWLARLDQGSLGQRFFGGGVTFATLMPMRAIPFRMVCLLGMQDGAYPRRSTPVDFDLMRLDYQPGDRSRREDDRYLFLEALLSVRERLYLSWVGRSIHDNSEQPPSVLVAQLRSHLDAGWALADGEGSVAEALTQVHPLQPFSLRYRPEPPATDWYTYSGEWRDRPAAPLTPAQALAPLKPEARLPLEALTSFVRHPVRAFFEQRLDVRFDASAAAARDEELFALDGLTRWQLRQNLLEQVRHSVEAGEDPAPAVAARLVRRLRQGDLPPGAFGELSAQALEVQTLELLARYQAWLAEWPQAREPEDVLVQPAAGLPLLVGRLTQRRDGPGGRARLVLSPSDVVVKDHYRGTVLLADWLIHLAAQLQGQPLTTIVVSAVGEVTLAPVPPDSAAQWLGWYLEDRARGLTAPLPLALRSAWAWVQDVRSQGEERALAAAAAAYAEEGQDPYLRRAFPDAGALLTNGEFPELAERWLRALREAMPVDKRKSGSGRGKADGKEST